MKRIPLVDKRGVPCAYSIVSDCDFGALSAERWHRGQVAHSPMAAGYAVRRAGQSLIRMHRQILSLSPGDGFQGDHINGDTLDNRRSNLRVVTHAQNMQNRRAAYGTSRFRGVQWDERKGKWRVRPRCNNKQVHVGYYQDELEAAHAAERWRAEHMPFAEPDPTLVAVLEVVAA